jgi:hypothetical protein
MPEHLQVYTLDERVGKLLADLGEWLKLNGSFAPGFNYFEECERTELGKRVGPLWSEAAALFNRIRSKTDVRNNTSCPAHH